MKTHHLWLILLAVTFTFIVTFPSMGQQSFDFISSVKKHRTVPTDTISTGDSIYIKKLECRSKETIVNQNPMSQQDLVRGFASGSHTHIPTSISVNTSKDVGVIPINSQVTPSGGLVYNVPISCVPVRSGIAPSVSIAYNSQGGNDIVGYGWSIGGLSSITRVPRSMYYDGKTAPVEVNGDDALMLDGVRLLPTTVVNVFETEQGNIRVKAQKTASGTFSYFTVLYPNGTVAVFGSQTNTSDCLVYPISKSTDVLGNMVSFSYAYQNNRYRILNIEYGAHTSSDTPLANIAFTYKDRVDVLSGFEGETEVKLFHLLDNIKCYHGIELLHTYSFVYKTSNVSLLTRIDCDNLNPLLFYYGYDNNMNGWEKQKAILTRYFNQDTDLVVNKVKFESGTEDDGLFSYPDFNPCAISSKGYYSAFAENQELLVYRNLEGSTLVPATLYAERGFQTLLSADVDGVSGDELLKINATVQSGKDRLTVKVYKPGLGLSLTQTSTFTFDSEAPNSSSIWPKVYLPGDYNGDGKAELLAISMDRPLDKDMNSKCYLFDLSTNKVLFNAHVFNFNVKQGILVAVDIDGDGKTDICHINFGITRVYSFSQVNGVYSLNLKCSFDLSYNYVFQSNRDMAIGDINGDGKPEFLVTPVKSYTKKGTYEMPVTSHEFCPECNAEYPEDYECVHCGEYIGYSNRCLVCGEWLDGSSCSVHGDVCQVEYWRKFHNGTWWEVYYPLSNIRRSFNLTEYVEHEAACMLQDIDQDGYVDLVLRQNTSTWGYFNRNGGFKEEDRFGTSLGGGITLLPSSISQPNFYSSLIAVIDENVYKVSFTRNERKQYLLTGVINSFGVIDKNSYQLLNVKNGDYIDFYSSNAIVSFPYERFQGPLWGLAAKETALNGSILTSEEYRYQGGVVHRQGRGFCGFTKIIAEDVLRNKTITTIYDPLNFNNLVRVITPEAEGNYTYYSAVASNKKATVRLNNSVEKDLLKSTTVTKDYLYDTYSNPTRETVTYTDYTSNNVIKTVTNQTYSNTNTTAKWLIGLPCLKTITESRDGSSWVTSEELVYKTGTNLPEKKIIKINGNKVGETRCTYDVYGNALTEVSAPRTAVEYLGDTCTYLNNCYVNTRTDALGRMTVYSNYNKYGLPEKVVNNLGKIALYNYDDLGRVNTTTYDDGTIENINYRWDLSTGVYYIEKSVTGMPEQRTYYDALGRDIRIGNKRFDGTWLYIDKQYDNWGRLWKVSLPYKGNTASLWNVYSYDDFDRIVSFSEPSGKTTSYSYIGKSETIVKESITTTRTYDKSGLLVSVTDPRGEITYSYRPDRQLKKVIASGGIVTEFDYDPDYGHRTKIVDPSAGTMIFTENYSGNIRTVTQTDANSKTLTIVYDKYGRPKSKVQPEFTTTYKYDPVTKQIDNATSTNGTSKVYTYDEYARLKSQTDKVSNDIWLKRVFAYANGNVASVTYSSSKEAVIGTENMVYTNGQLTEVKFGTTSVWKLTAENALGQPTTAVTGPLTRTYGYNSYGMLTERKAGEIQHFAYTFDIQKGNLTSRVDKKRNLTESFSYDNLNRLANYAGKTVGYDSKGNITSMSGIGTMFYSHDTKPYAVTNVELNGNQIPMRNQDVTYTSFQRPATIVENDYIATFTYDSSGERVKMLLTHNGAVQNTTYYLGNCYETNNTETRLYLAGDYYSSPIVYMKKNGSWGIYYICRDYLGSITHITNSAGVVQQELSYDAWGRLRNPINHVLYAPGLEPALLLGRGYTGHEHLSVFGLVNMNARLYDSALGRFLSPDPYVQMMDFTQNFNRYSYALNNPLMYVDKSGKSVWLAAVIVGAWIGMGTAMVMSDNSGWALAGDMLKGLFIGGASGAAGYFAGGAMAGLLGTTSFIGGAVTGFSGGFAGGFVGGAGNAWLNGANFKQGLNAGLAAGGISGTIGGVIGGALGGISAMKKQGNFFTGKGAISIEESISDVSELGGDYFSDDELMKEYIESQIGWSEGDYGIMNISVEADPQMMTLGSEYYRGDGGILCRAPRGGGGVTELGGLTKTVNAGIFRSPRVSIYMSPHQSLSGFALTLNHELIHAYHRTLGFVSFLGSGFRAATEQTAYAYQLSHALNMNQLMNAVQGLNTYRSPYMLPLPNYLIKF